MHQLVYILILVSCPNQVFLSTFRPENPILNSVHRIMQLYLQYVRTPMFNPEAKRYSRMALPDPPQARPRSDGRRDIEYCQSCSTFKPRTYFNMSAGSASLAQCQACRRLDNDARTRLDLSLYKSLLDNIKAEEEARQNLASPAFILQESDIRFCIAN